MSPSLQSSIEALTDLGIVVIGRNEGDRLARCLQSIGGHVASTVYVDSGSCDQSVVHARQMGAFVVELNPADPFTAAKARNAGLRSLIELRPHIRFVQFVDGDCELAANWLTDARQKLMEQSDVAVVCGRRREQFKDASIYNRLCDMEWDTPSGEVRACGGDAMMRVAAFAEVGGFRASMIAGEEPELCVRLRGRGWKILRLGDEMTLHDAAIVHFSQWWRRSMRAAPYSHYPEEERKRRAAVSDEFKEVDHAKLREAMILWVRKTGQKVLVCPEMTYQLEMMDELLIDSLPADVKKHVVKRDTYWLPDEAGSVYAKARAVVSFEMHSPIISASKGTPAIYLRQPSDTRKGQMWRDIGLKDWIFEIDDARGQDIGERVLAIHDDYDAALKKLATAMAFVKQRQKITMAMVAKAAGV